MSVTSRLQLSIPARARPVPGGRRSLAHVRQARLRRRGGAIFPSILHGATLPTEGRRRRDGLDWGPAKGPRRPPGPGPPRTLPARSSPWLSSAPAQDAVEGPATESTPGLDPRARPRGDPDTFGRCGHLDHLSDHRDASLARMSQVSTVPSLSNGTSNLDICKGLPHSDSQKHAAAFQFRPLAQHQQWKHPRLHSYYRDEAVRHFT